MARTRITAAILINLSLSQLANSSSHRWKFALIDDLGGSNNVNSSSINRMIRGGRGRVTARLFVDMFAANLILIAVFAAAGGQELSRCDYFWKFYDGTIPKDAVEGGKDSSGNSFYIALVHLKLVNEILPGMIIPSIKAARITSYAAVQNVKHGPNTEVKILCSTYKNGFEWIRTKSEDLHLLAGLVPGGKILGQNLFIGRVEHEGGMVLGTVFPHSFVFKGLYVPSRGTYVQYLTYEVLAFNCGVQGESLEEEGVVDDSFHAT